MNYKIIIDTDKYAGNFEREMCAFATAQVGECGVGEEQVDKNHSYKDWWANHIIQVEDRGCYRPVALSATPGYINDGMGKHYLDTVENRLVAHQAAVDKMIEYHKSQRDMIEMRMRDRCFQEDNNGRGWTEEACIRTLKSMDHKINSMKMHPTVHPAYLSIEILVNEAPSGPVMQDFEARVYAFADDNKINIQGIRIQRV